MKKPLIILFLGLAGAFGTLSAQSSRMLFNYQENPILSLRQQHFLAVITKNPVNVAYRLVTVNHPLFEQTGPIVLNLEGLTSDARTELIIRQTQLERRSREEYSWQGSMDAWPLFGVNFVYDRGFVHGMISTVDGLYGIEPIGEGLHVLLKKAPGNYPEEGCRKTTRDAGETPAARQNRQAKARNEENSGKGDCNIRLLVAFTDDVFAAHADPRGEIQLATDNFNTSNQNSGVEHRVELARVMQVNYAESGIAATDLPFFRNNGDGIMDEVHAARDLYDADLCCLIVDSLDACGLASGIGSSYTTAFQITAFGCAAGNLSFAHEFGHLLNARHDTFVDGTAGANHALVNLAGGWRTVMAYNDECDCSDEVSPCPAKASRATPGMPSCTRIQWWSNPLVNFSGAPTGTSIRNDNRSALDGADNGVIAFEGLVVNKILSSAETVGQQEEGNLLAEQTIENTSGTPVQYVNDAKGTYRAGNSVTLRPGFWAQNGADFRAFIESCTNTLSTQANSENREQQADLKISTELKIFPNPVAGSAGIDYQVGIPGTISITLLNNLGTTLQTLVAPAYHEAGSYHAEADLSLLPAGLYYVRYSDGQRSKVVSVAKIEI